MARTSDYEGLSFGEFKILKNVAAGASSDVFVCRHRGTGVVYILRLDSKDEALWAGAPLVPPRNASIEVPNAVGTWETASAHYQESLEAIRTQGSNAWKLVPVPVYGVIDHRYVVPVACPVRVKGAWDVDRLLEAAPADDLFLFELWEDVLGTIVVAAHRSTAVLDEGPWSTLAGGRILGRAIAQYLRGGGLAQSEQDAITRSATVSRVDGFELAENLIIRLCGCIQRKRMRVDEVVATLQCRHFRLNITRHEAMQAVAVYEALSEHSMGAESSLEVLLLVLRALGEPPLDPFKDTGSFEIRSTQPSLEPYSLFLQESAGSNQEVIVLGVSRR